MTDDDEKIVDQFVRDIEDVEAITVLIEKATAQTKRIRRCELIRALAFGATMSLTGSVFGWGWQHGQPQVWITALVVAALLIGHACLEYKLNRLQASRAVNFAAVLDRTCGKERRGGDV